MTQVSFTPIPTPSMARRRIVCAAGAAMLLGGGCRTGGGDQDNDRRMESQPEAGPLNLPDRVAGRPRIAWVLSSGGPRGFVHVGVLKGLSALGLQPDFIVGASVGAVVGTLWAAGLHMRLIEERALDLQPWDVLRPGFQSGVWLSGGGLAALINDSLGGRLLQDLPIPMACVAIRLADGEVVAFTRGDAGLAVQASSAIVGQLAPVQISGKAYADADQNTPLPVRLAHRLGANRVLAVDASAHEDRAPPSAQRYREADLRKRAATRLDSPLADVLIHPDTGYWTGWSRAYRERLIALGEAAVMAQEGALIKLHSRISR
ncbi:MAG: patatin-like phospholipase family protein [Betaproteobacteria bacterium]